jgi:hypothetical protein
MAASDHRSATGSNITSQQAAQLGCTTGRCLLGIKPQTATKTARKPRLLAIQEAQTPLSQSLRPVRPPEEGERGAGWHQATLKGKAGEESSGRGVKTDGV